MYISCVCIPYCFKSVNTAIGLLWTLSNRALCRIKMLPVTTLSKNLMIHVYNFIYFLLCYLILCLYAITQLYNNVLFNDIFQLLQPCIIKKQVTLCCSVNNKITYIMQSLYTVLSSNVTCLQQIINRFSKTTSLPYSS